MSDQNAQPPSNQQPPASGSGLSPSTPGYNAPAYGSGAYAQPQKTNVLAIVSLVTSILGWFVGITLFAGIICGHIALSQIKKTKEGGRGLAIAGLIVGYIGIALAVIAIILAILLIPAILTGISQIQLDSSTF